LDHRLHFRLHTALALTVQKPGGLCLHLAPAPAACSNAGPAVLPFPRGNARPCLVLGWRCIHHPHFACPTKGNRLLSDPATAIVPPLLVYSSTCTFFIPSPTLRTNVPRNHLNNTTADPIALLLSILDVPLSDTLCAHQSSRRVPFVIIRSAIIPQFRESTLHTIPSKTP